MTLRQGDMPAPAGTPGRCPARQTIESYLEAQDNNASEAAVRALCNWPNAEVADRLLAIATNSGDKRYCRWALRALTCRNQPPER